MKEKKNDSLSIVGVLILLISVVILFGTLWWLVHTTNNWSNAIHENRMEELELEKEIILLKSTLEVQDLEVPILETPIKTNFSCVITTYLWNGSNYLKEFEYVDNCYRVLK